MLNRYITDIYVPLQLGSSDALGNCFRQLVIPCPVTLPCSHTARMRAVIYIAQERFQKKVKLYLHLPSTIRSVTMLVLSANVGSKESRRVKGCCL